MSFKQQSSNEGNNILQQQFNVQNNNDEECCINYLENVSNNITNFYVQQSYHHQQLNHNNNTLLLSSSSNEHNEDIIHANEENTKDDNDKETVIGLIQTVDGFLESLKRHKIVNESKHCKSNPGQCSTVETWHHQHKLQNKTNSERDNSSLSISEVRKFEIHTKLSKTSGEVTSLKGFDNEMKKIPEHVPVRYDTVSSLSPQTKRIPFPQALYEMLEEANDRGCNDIVSWQEDGNSFRVIDVDRFVNEMMSTIFKQTKFRSFQRQLSLYGFKNRKFNMNNNTKVQDFGSCYYYHEHFRKGEFHLVCTIRRTAIKGNYCRVEQQQILQLQLQQQNTFTTDLVSMSPVNRCTRPSTMIAMSKHKKTNTSTMSDIEVTNEEDSWQHHMPLDDNA